MKSQYILAVFLCAFLFGLVNAKSDRGRQAENLNGNKCTFNSLNADDNEQSCSVRSTDAAKCKCLEKELERLEDECSAHKKWFKKYRKQVVENHCDCLKKCDKQQDCIDAALKQLPCLWKPLNEEIVTENTEVNATIILALIQSAKLKCLNKNVRNCCEGPGCSPLFKNATKSCIMDLFDSVIPGVDNQDIRGWLENYKKFYARTLDKYKDCEKQSDAVERSSCYQQEYGAATEEFNQFQQSLIDKVGSTNAGRAIAIITEGVINCQVEWERKNTTLAGN